MDRQTLRTFIESEFAISSELLADDEPLFSSGILDSFGLVQLVGFIEASDGCSVESTDLTFDNFDSVNRILTFCGRQLR